MCCRSCWQRIIPFFLTFWLGLFLTGFFDFGGIPLDNLEREVAPPVEQFLNQTPTDPFEAAGSQIDAKRRVCVPADPNLKYRDLPLRESEYFPAEHLSDLESVEKQNGENSSRNDKSKIKSERKPIRRMEDIEGQNNSQHSLKLELIYIEKCFEK
ncbi:MAG: hypothetical protein R2747_19175 [Pyrinomonadaceae bacterium]